MQYIDDLKQRPDDVEGRVDQLERTVAYLQERIAYLATVVFKTSIVGSVQASGEVGGKVSDPTRSRPTSYREPRQRVSNGEAAWDRARLGQGQRPASMRRAPCSLGRPLSPSWVRPPLLQHCRKVGQCPNRPVGGRGLRTSSVDFRPWAPPDEDSLHSDRLGGKDVVVDPIPDVDAPVGACPTGLDDVLEESQVGLLDAPALGRPDEVEWEPGPSEHRLSVCSHIPSRTHSIAHGNHPLQGRPGVGIDVLNREAGCTLPLPLALDIEVRPEPLQGGEVTLTALDRVPQSREKAFRSDAEPICPSQPRPRLVDQRVSDVEANRLYYGHVEHTRYAMPRAIGCGP
jgi:hypothetical protein